MFCGLGNWQRQKPLCIAIEIAHCLIVSRPSWILLVSNYGKYFLSSFDKTNTKFKLVDFEDNENKLVPAGANCLRMPEQDIEPVAAEHIVVKQGYQESSNVKIVEELVDMIMVSRLYEANMNFITASKETSSSIIDVAMG